MLRLSPSRDPLGALSVRLEGRLAGPWVGELRRWWESERARGASRAPAIDLSEVSFIDAEGRELLRSLAVEGAELSAGGCLTCAVVEEIREAARSERAASDAARRQP